jgi:hypothetical protein
MVSHFVWHLTLSLFHEISQYVYEMHCDEVQGVPWNFSANFCCTKSVYLLPSRKTYSTRKTRYSIPYTSIPPQWVKTELNNYTLYRYCTSTTVEQLNTVKQQHTAMAISILTTKSTYCSLSAQRLSKHTVLHILDFLFISIDESFHFLKKNCTMVFMFY